MTTDPVVPPRQRYDQCDDTCTADCGHCKGAGRPVVSPVSEVRRRIKAAQFIPHNHREYVEGCFRCDLSRGESS